MNEYYLLQSHLRKLEDFCADAGLKCVVHFASYPIAMEVSPRTDYAQMSILPEQATMRANSRIRFTLEEDEIQHSVLNDFLISKSNLNKLDGFFQKIASAYLQHFFRTLVRNDEIASIVAPLVAIDGDE